MEFNPNLLQDLLPIYYKRVFPHKLFYKWLSYGNSENSIFSNREFSFTLMDDIYVRYLCFENQSELEHEIHHQNPFKIDIGAVMNVRPKDHRIVSNLVPVQRELVFDIDMTDYDDIRTCCSGSDICQKCWKFMAVACNVIETTLAEDFGYEHILWVFSGRRGIHCWVCDRDARLLDGKGRSAIADYINILSPSMENILSKVVLGDRMHHSIKRAHKIVAPLFEEICLVDQNIFGTQKGIGKLLSLISDNDLRLDLDAKFKNLDSADSKMIWNTFVNHIKSKSTKNESSKYIIEEIQLALLYPRIDINVTKGFNHLLKAPFCVHPKTGKICVPFSSMAAFKFDPTSVPTIQTLLNEINLFDDKQIDSETEEANRIKDYKKTSMFKGIYVFEEFLRKLEKTFIGKAIKVSDAKMEF